MKLTLKSGKYVKRRLWLTLSILAVLAMLALSAANFNRRLDRKLTENAADHLQNHADIQRPLVRMHLKNLFRELETVAGALSGPDGPRGQATRILLRDAELHGSFRWLAAGQGGTVRRADGTELDIAHSEAFALAQEGKHEIRGQGDEIVLTIPILSGGEPVGTLQGGYPVVQLTNFLSQYAFGSNSATFIADGKGAVLTGLGQAGKLFPTWRTLDEFFSNAVFRKGNNRNDITADMRVNIRGSARLRVEGTDLLLVYTPLEISNWYLFNAVPYSVIQKDGASISQDTYTIILELLAAFFLILTYLLIDNRRTVNALSDQQKEMRASAARYKLISARSKDVILEYDLRKGLVMHCENAGVLDSPDMRGSNFVKNIVEKGMVHPEDAGLFHSNVDAVGNGARDAELDLRMKLDTDCYNWYRLSMVCVKDDEGQPWRVVARASNIDQQKREQQMLQQEAIRDPLTKLYNKVATRNRIEQALERCPDRCHALMIIDVDNFKQINDSCGHMCGDAVLQKAAESILKLFRSSDIAGRIGGDEFMIFFRDVGNRNNASRRARQVCDIFQTVGQELEPPVSISCSLGVALYPECGLGFDQLYGSADRALYSVKRQSKNGFAFFDSETMTSGTTS